MFKRLHVELGSVDLKWNVAVALCHMATVDASSSPGSLVCLKSGGKIEYCDFTSEFRLDSRVPIRIPLEMKKWWGEQGTGFIYSKSSVKVTLDANAVNRVLELHKIMRLYDMWGLWMGMEDMMAKGSSDFKYFEVKGALEFFCVWE